MAAENPPGERLTLDELTTFLKLSLDCAERAYSNGLRFHFYEPRERYAVLLLLTVLDYARDVVALIQARYGAIAIVARSALDAYTDISVTTPIIGSTLPLRIPSWKQLLERASRGGNPMLKGLSEDDLLRVGARMLKS